MKCEPTPPSGHLLSSSFPVIWGWVLKHENREGLSRQGGGKGERIGRTVGPAQHREKEQLERAGEIGRETRGRDKPIIASLSPPSSTSAGFLHSYAIGSFTQLHCPCTLCLVSQNINKSTNNFEARFYKTGRHTYSVQNGLSCVHWF